jgi:hypothetical protein
MKNEHGITLNTQEREVWHYDMFISNDDEEWKHNLLHQVVP